MSQHDKCFLSTGNFEWEAVCAENAAKAVGSPAMSACGFGVRTFVLSLNMWRFWVVVGDSPQLLCL